MRWGDPGQNRHLGVFGAFLAVPDQRLNTARYFGDTGLVAYGVARGRPRDFAAIGVAYASFADSLQHGQQAGMPAIPPIAMRDFESTIEATYGWALRPGLVVQPSIQYILHPRGNILHPRGTRMIPNAVAMGVNLVINL